MGRVDHGLRRSDPDGPGLRRVRRGRGFTYLDADGEPVRDAAVLDRIRALAIPPAWQDVWICPRADGHLQAVGVDDAGRRQYRYHDRWRLDRDEEKHARARRLAARLPAVRERIAEDLAQRGLGRERVLAGALRLLDLGIFRTGNKEYADGNGSHGVATLLRSHVMVRRGRTEFRFPAKGGVERSVGVRDPDLAKLIAALRRNRADTDRLFAYRDGPDRHDVQADEVNDRFRELAGEGFTVKDLRTWAATVAAAAEFAELDEPAGPTAAARAEAAVMRTVADKLGNTPAVARKSYVDPVVPEKFRDGETIPEPDGDRDHLDKAVRDLLSG